MNTETLITSAVIFILILQKGKVSEVDRTGAMWSK